LKGNGRKENDFGARVNQRLIGERCFRFIDFSFYDHHTNKFEFKNTYVSRKIKGG